MSLKYKIIIILIVSIMLTIVPASLYMMDKRESDLISAIVQQQTVISSIMAQTTLNILLMNGGDIETSCVDVKEMFTFLRPFFSEGLIYADAILMSSGNDKNGAILASISRGPLPTFLLPWNNRVDNKTLEQLLASSGRCREYTDPSGETYMIFSAYGALPGKPPFCIGRLVFSKSVILAPVRSRQRLMMVAFFLFLVFIMTIGYIFTTFLSQRITTLIRGVKMIEAGNLSGSISVESHDELGVLAEAFNTMARKLEQKIIELQKTNEALSRMDRIKDEFLANTSHELRTPINGIVGITESLLEGAAGEMNENMRKNLSMIASSGRRLGGLVNDILDFSRLRNSDIELQFTAVDMRVVTDLVLSIMRTLGARKNIMLVNLIGPECPLVIGDEDRLQQVLLNLVGNAIKFSEKGDVIVSAETVTHGIQRYLAVSVTDSGIGIPEDALGRIFQSFEQGDGSVSRTYGGTGLGLAISRKLLELHGGDIQVASRDGEGSCFTFTIPLCEERRSTGVEQSPDRIARKINYTVDRMIEKQGAVASGQADAGSAHGRILIVDDEPVNLQVLINHLGIEGYDVLIATNGPEALKIIEDSGAPDLVLLDIMMPQMSGFEVCRIIRRKYSSHELPVVIITARKRTDDIIAGIEAGANDYLLKPFDRQELLARVRNLLILKHAVREQRELSILEKEMATARQIQRSILPEKLPSMPGLDIQAGYRPMRAVGGDLYDFYPIDEKRIGIFIADVSGHGTPAAIISSMLKVVFSLSPHAAENPAFVLEWMNTSLSGYSHGHFISALYAIVDLEQRLLTVANAGHWPLLLWRARENSLVETGKPGRIIGFFPELRISSHTVPLETGDRLILYTDGILEQRDPSGRLYGEDGFHAMIRSSGNLAARDMIETLFMSLSAWSGSEQTDVFEDDVTIVVIDLTD